MRLPYLQVTQETWDNARSLAGLTNQSVGTCFMALCDLWKWGIGLGDQECAPEGVCESPNATRLLCAAVNWTSNCADFVAALVDLGLIEVLPNGHTRVRGMGRYKRTFEKNRRKPARPVPETGTFPAPPAPVPARQTQTQTQTQIEALKTLSKDFQNPIDLTLSPTSPKEPAPADQVFEHWKKATGKTAGCVFDKKRTRLVKARLADGYTVEQLNLAIDGCAADPFSQGQNDRGKKYDDLGLICRDAAHVEKFIECARAKAPPAKSKAKTAAELYPLEAE